MWQRFPPRMRKALVAALDEAGRFGRETAGVDDLLCAIAADRESAGAFLLEQCSVEVSKIVDRPPPSNRNGNGNGHPQTLRARCIDESSLRILKIAEEEADRLQHDHIGTEHVVAALTRADDLQIGQKLNAAGMTPAAAEQAIERWIAEGMPRRRGSWGWGNIRPKFLAKILRPLQRAARFAPLPWKIFIRKSLAHPRFVSNPYPLYRWLREHEPVRKDPLAPVWVLTRYDDVMEILRDPRFLKDPFASQRVPKLLREQLGVGNEDTRVESEVVSMLFLDPPRHTKVRGVFARAFTPASLSQLKPRIELIARKRIDRVASTGRMDIIADLANPLPVIVIAEMLGYPPEDFPRIKTWSDVLAASLSLRPTPKQQADATMVWGEMREYFDAVVERTRKKPGFSLLSKILEDENDPEGLNRDEIFTNSVLLLAAGHETTTNLIGNGMLALLRNRDQWDQLTRDPSLIESAVVEILRYDPPVQWTSRVTGELIELNGQTIKAGEIILGSVGAANRDPDKFPDPDKFDIRRTGTRNLAFGSGIHYCLGAALARMEAEIAIGQLAARFPGMRLATNRVKWMKGLTFRGAMKLPVVLR
jgi:cytochrome P450